MSPLILGMFAVVLLIYQLKSNTTRLEHVVFGETAVNYEEGKFEEKDGVKVFSPDYDVVQSPSGDMQAFAQPKTNLRYHYGQYISGSAVREDATAIFEKMRSQVSFHN